MDLPKFSPSLTDEELKNLLTDLYEISEEVDRKYSFTENYGHGLTETFYKGSWGEVAEHLYNEIDKAETERVQRARQRRNMQVNYSKLDGINMSHIQGGK